MQTKLHAPLPRPGLVMRPRLCERLVGGTQRALTLLSAPAGFGKTTLLAEWLAADPTEGRVHAWVSLDRRDDDPAVFWTYVIAALDGSLPGIGADAAALLRSPQPSIEAALATLVNDLSAQPSDLVLVLDDYHVITSTDIHDGMGFLVDHLPPQVHLVIASRADPAIPLAGLRARGDLIEIRVADLRFTADEASVYLDGALGFSLAHTDVTALEGRTEGWIAALQLAALSMQGRTEISSFIASFAGDDRYIVDYLVEEVLQRQPDHVGRFLLHTSILSGLSGPLCDAVTGQPGSRAMLESLERGNVFVVPLDDRRSWYRYHHLFADVLRARLLDEEGDVVPLLHARASDWYEGKGERLEAIHHALAGDHVERAADLIELAGPALLRDRREATLCGWMERLPDALFEVRPVLSISYVGALMSTGQVDRAAPRLRAAERWLDVTTDLDGRPGAPEMVVADPAQLREVPGAIEMYRAALALAGGDANATAVHARRAIELSPDGDHMPRAGGTALLGLASWHDGALEDARQAYTDSMAMMHRVGHASDVLACALAVADLELAQGRLGDARRTFERALKLVGADSGSVVRGMADMHVGLSEVHRERNDLQAAAQELQRSQELGAHSGLPQHPYRWRVATARMRQADGDLDGAVDLLDEAARVYTGDYSPDVRPIPAMRATLDVARGALDEARHWVREAGVTPDDDLSYLREYEHLTLARVLLATEPPHRSGDVVGLLDRLLAAAEAGGRPRSVLEISVVQALASDRLGNGTQARACLRRALHLAEAEGYVRTFLDEGPPLTSLLWATVQDGAVGDHARRLLAADEGAQPTTSAFAAMVDPLSDRELDVLRLLATDLSGPDIARELVVSLSTVRSHTKHIYTKLGVTNRRAAVRQASELRLLSTGH